MTQTAETPKTGFVFPSEQILIIRPCLKTACLHIKPAAKLLSALLYHARKCPLEQEIFIFQGTQEELMKDMCDEVSDKTLHDIAIPTLLLLGFLDIEEVMGGNKYTLYLARIRAALAAYIPEYLDKPQIQLEKVLIGYMQLEKFLIDREKAAKELIQQFPDLKDELADPGQLEKVLINKKFFYLQLEKVLIQIRKSSNCRRGPKPNPEGRSRGKSKDTENLRDSKRDITKRKDTYGDVADANHRPLSPLVSDEAFEMVVSDWLEHRATPTSERTLTDHSPVVKELAWQLQAMKVTMQYLADEETVPASPVASLVNGMVSENEIERHIHQRAYDIAESQGAKDYWQGQAAKAITAPLSAIPTVVGSISEELPPSENDNHSYPQASSQLPTSSPQGDARPLPSNPVQDTPPLPSVRESLPLNAESSLNGKSEPQPSQTPLSPAKPSVAQSRGKNDGIQQPSLMEEAHLNTTSSQVALRKEPPHQHDTPDRIARDTTGNVALSETGDADVEQKKSEQPAEPAPKGKGGRKKNNGIDMTPVPPPARPAEDMPWGVEKMMAWCDYARRSAFPVSPRSETKYMKALNACKHSVGRGITENNFLIIYFNRMKGIDLDLNDLDPSIPRSEGWQDYPVDAWVFDEHYEDEAKKYRRAKEEKGTSQKRKDETTPPPTRQPQNPLKASEEWKKRMAAAQGGK